MSAYVSVAASSDESAKEACAIISVLPILVHRPTPCTGSVKNRRLSRRLQAIDALPKRDQEALLRTIDAFISKTA
jgi:hypothetical protein